MRQNSTNIRMIKSKRLSDYTSLLWKLSSRFNTSGMTSVKRWLTELIKRQQHCQQVNLIRRPSSQIITWPSAINFNQNTRHTSRYTWSLIPVSIVCLFVCLFKFNVNHHLRCKDDSHYIETTALEVEDVPEETLPIYFIYILLVTNLKKV